MGLDIRLPIGLLFFFVGVLLTIFGAVRPQHSESVGVNINLLWGVVLLVFGALMFFFGRRGVQKKRSAPQSTASPERELMRKGH
jgi:hypothetical protein